MNFLNRGRWLGRGRFAGIFLIALLSFNPFDLPRPPPPVVVLDPGHGGDDLGMRANSIVERESNLDMAQRVEALLTRKGVIVLLTRRSDDHAVLPDQPADATGATAMFLDLQARVGIANAAHADAFVSIHSNFWRDATQRGLQVWINRQRPFADQNRVLADALVERIGGELQLAGNPIPTGDVRDDADLVDPSGSATPLFVIGPEREVSREEIMGRHIDPAAVGLGPSQGSIVTDATRMPGAVIELLYMTNYADAALLSNDGSRDAMARGIADGLLQYLRSKRSG